MKKPEGERVVNKDYHAQIQEHLMDELYGHMEKRDHAKIRECLMALGHCFQDEEIDEV